MELYIDKYRPKTFDEFLYNEKAVSQMKALARSDNIPHMIIHGHQGCGKKTLASLYLAEKFGIDVLKVKSKIIELKYSNKTVELLLLYSGYHYQINPSSHGVYDRLIFLDFIKNIAQYGTLNSIKYRIIIVEHADLLTNEAQQALRRTLEKYVSSCRFIFLVSNEGAMIDALQSRCIKIRLRSPKITEMGDFLVKVANTEGISTDLALNIANNCEHNYKRGLHYLQFAKVAGITDFSLEKIEPSYAYIHKICVLILNGGSINKMLEIRNTLYELLTHCVDPIWIIRQLLINLLAKINDKYFNVKNKLIKAANHAEQTLRMGSKAIYHLEGFTVSSFRAITSN